MDRDTDRTISTIYSDILQNHILTRLDGPALAAFGTTSSQLYNLSTEDALWRDICHRMCPSTAHPLLRHIITSFPSGHRSFYAAASSTLQPHNLPPTGLRWSPTLISAVDIYYEKHHPISKVHETDTLPVLSTGSHFRVGLLDLGEEFPIPGKLDFKDLACESELENNLTLSWILIDPNRTRAANLTGMNPVSVDRDWSNGDVQVRFGSILSHHEGELVQCTVVVTCGMGWENDDLHMKEVTLLIEDVEGNKIGWKDSLVILQQAMESGERTRRGEKGGQDEFSTMKRERKEKKMRSRRRRERVAICFGLVVVLIGFCVYAMCT